MGFFSLSCFACCERAPSLTASLHPSILQPTEVQSAAGWLKLLHICYATARLLFEVMFSGSFFQLLCYCCHFYIYKTYHGTATQLGQGHCFSFSSASHLPKLWACFPALQGCKHHDSPSNWLSGPIFDLSFWELEISSGNRDQKVLL